jgi:hypothetical protein
VCPVCADIGSTQEEEKCHECYIEKACKAPFDEGFRDDHQKGATYFGAMREFLSNHKRPLVVCGTFNQSGGKASKIGATLAKDLHAHILNGGIPEGLRKEGLLKGYDLVVWMADVPNDVSKYYPKKDKGSVLVVSKVMREGYTRVDSSKRIFEMKGNAVIEIEKDPEGRLRFVLVDALSNVWKKSSDIADIAGGIIDLADWTDGSVRVGSLRVGECLITEAVRGVVEVARDVADKVEAGTDARYFGNLSTRCMSMFPSARGIKGSFVSPRDIDKRRIEPEDMVFVHMSRSGTHFAKVVYRTDRKPSVDTAVQLEIYMRTDVNFLIHGHAYIEGAPFTEHYFPCGDLREVHEVVPLICQQDFNGVINLKNHGFLLFSETIESLREIVAKSIFKDRLLSDSDEEISL